MNSTASGRARVALETGAGGVIGGAAVHAMLSLGWNVVGVDSDEGNLARLRGETAAEHASRLLTRRADVTYPEELDDCTAIDDGIDYFFNNAGSAGPVARIESGSSTDFLHVMTINALGVFKELRAVARTFDVMARSSTPAELFGVNCQVHDITRSDML